jgi:hypothetical protein
MPSPTCTVDATSTTNGFDADASTSTEIALAATTGVDVWSIECIGTDEDQVVATINASLTIDQNAKTATFTTPADACALIFRSTVNRGKDVNGTAQTSYATTFGIYVLTAGGHRLGAVNETLEGNATFGWVAKVNALIRDL